MSSDSSGYKREREQDLINLSRQFIIILFLLVIIIFLAYGWTQARKQIDLHYPPDLRSYQVLKVGEIPTSEIFTTVSYLFENVSLWHDNGEIDFEKNTRMFGSFMTDKYKLERNKYYEENKGTLKNRVQELHKLPGASYDESKVKPLGAGSWLVWLDYRVVQKLGGLIVHDDIMRYPIRVVKSGSADVFNPFGYKIDGFMSPGPQLLVKAEGIVPTI